MLKLFVLFLLLAMMVIGFSHSVMASGMVYMDRFFGGEVNTEGHADQDLDAAFVGAGFSMGKWKAGFEYGEGDVDGVVDVSLLSVKAGYRVLDARASKLDVTLSSLDLDAKNTYELKSNALIGLDYTQFFSEKFFMSLTVQRSIDGSFTYDKYSAVKTKVDGGVFVPRIKFTYMINDNVAVTAGYSQLSFKVDAASPYDALDRDTTLGGYTLGMLYRF